MNLFPRNLEANFARYQDGKYLFDKSNTLLTRRLLTIDEMSVEVKRGYKRTTSSSPPVLRREGGCKDASSESSSLLPPCNPCQ